METKINIANKYPLIDEIASLKLIVVLKLLITKVQMILIIAAIKVKEIVVIYFDFTLLILPFGNAAEMNANYYNHHKKM